MRSSSLLSVGRFQGIVAALLEIQTKIGMKIRGRLKKTDVCVIYFQCAFLLFLLTKVLNSVNIGKKSGRNIVRYCVVSRIIVHYGAMGSSMLTLCRRNVVPLHRD